MANSVTNTAKGRVRQYVDAAIANQTSGATVAGTTAWTVTTAGSPGLLLVLYTGTLTAGTDIDSASIATTGTGLATTATTGLTECVTSGYKRQLLTSITGTVSNTTDDYITDAADAVWGGASAIAAGTAITKLAVCFVPCVGGTLVTNSGNTGQQPGGTGMSTDANIIPLSVHDFAITPDGSDITAAITNILRSA